MRKTLTELNTELYQANQTINELKQQLEKEKEMKQYYSNNLDKLTLEQSQINLLFDAMNIPDKIKSRYGYDESLNIMQRMFIWINNYKEGKCQ